MANVPDDVFFSTISEVSTRLRGKEFSTVELTRAFCDRLERIGPRFNALALSLREQAIRQAKDVDSELKRGRTRGPLQGIPYGVKDLLAVKGHPTTWGAKPFAGQVFDEDAFVIDKLNKAGAILVGKLAMVELAGGGGYRLASASLTGPGLNPWDRTRWSGGSSSGSAAASAAGLVAFALGSETSGSIVTPSAFCGVTGLRPTSGLVSRRGAMALSWTLDKIGPICRSVEDCGLVLHVISGGDSNDPGSAGKGFYYAPEFAKKPAEMKVGFAAADTERADPETRPAFEAAMKTLRDTGANLVEVKLPDYPWGALINTVVGAEAASVFETLITSGQVDQLADPSQIENLKAALTITSTQYLKAMRIRALIKKSFRELFDNVDLLVAPARYGIATKISEPIGGGASDLIPAANLAGLPGISFPCGFASN